MIEYQNNFISNISEKYFDNNKIEEINIQDASENDIIKFSPFDDQFLQILLKNILLKNNLENESLIKIDIDYEGIESELVEKILFGLKKFRKKIRTMKYNEEKIQLDDDILDDFINKYKNKLKNINKEQKDSLKNFIKENKLENQKDLLLSIQSLMIFIMSRSDQKFTSETGIQDVINEIEKTKIVEYKINLIQPFFGSGKNEDNNDDNQKQNEIQTYQIKNLYSIYDEIYKIINKDKN